MRQTVQIVVRIIIYIIREFITVRGRTFDGTVEAAGNTGANNGAAGDTPDFQPRAARTTDLSSIQTSPRRIPSVSPAVKQIPLGVMSTACVSLSKFV